MILAVFGTTGELIKLAPVLVRLRERGAPVELATTGQQVEQLPALLAEVGLPQPLWLARGAGGRDLRSNADIPGWLVAVGRSLAREGPALRRRLREGGRPLVLVHGDTMTTFLGATAGRALGAPVAHVEGGVRSFDLLHPFPEELVRRAVSRLASIHYAPGAVAAANLRGRGEVVDTGANTLFDSVRLAPLDGELPRKAEEPFGLVSLHRYELLRSRPLLEATLRLLRRHAERRRLLFVDHPVTIHAVRRLGLDGLFDEERFVRVPRLGFFAFVTLLRRAELLVTDSGGSQAECWYLDKPCLVHRKVVEHREGLGETTLVSGLRLEPLEAFLADPSGYRRRTPLPSDSPSERIVAHLAQSGFLVP